MSAEVTIAAERSALIYADGWGQAHVLTEPSWSADRIDYVERATLAARLRALAEVIDPGTWDEHAERIRARTGAEVTRP